MESTARLDGLKDPRGAPQQQRATSTLITMIERGLDRLRTKIDKEANLLSCLLLQGELERTKRKRLETPKYLEKQARRRRKLTRLIDKREEQAAQRNVA